MCTSPSPSSPLLPTSSSTWSSSPLHSSGSRLDLPLLSLWFKFPRDAMHLWLLLDSATCFLSPSLLSGLLFSIRSLKVYNDVFYCKGAHKLKFSNTANCCWGSRSVATMSRAQPGIMSLPTASASPGSSFLVPTQLNLLLLKCINPNVLISLSSGMNVDRLYAIRRPMAYVNAVCIRLESNTNNSNKSKIIQICECGMYQTSEQYR